MTIAGHATPGETLEFSHWAVEKKGANASHFREVCDLKLSSLGIGTYLGEADGATDKLVEEAVLESVASGAVFWGAKLGSGGSLRGGKRANGQSRSTCQRQIP